VAAALRRITTGQFDQTLLDIPLDLDLVGARRLPSAQQGNLQSLSDQLPPDTGDGPRADVQSRDDLLVGVLLAQGVVGQQEEAGMDQLAGRGLAARNRLCQVLPFCFRQVYSILVHRRCPVLGVSLLPDRQESGYDVYPSNEGG
jgi:hypothetical protein